MKKKNRIIFLTFTLMLFVFLLWSRLTRHAPDLTPGERQTQSKSLFDGSSNQANSIASLQTRTATISNQQTSDVSDINNPEIVKKSIEAKNMPLDFYGKVIDQDSNPISNVKILVRIRHWNARFPTEPGPAARFITMQKSTDSSGAYRLNGETGDGFDIESIEKDGYELEPMQQSFGAIGGSVENPMVFKMWSTNIHESLISGSKSFQIVPDGRVYSVDLTKGAISESGEGDLKIWIKRPEQISSGKHFDWSCEIKSPNGGLQQATDAAMFSAPTEKYVPSFYFDQKVGSGWSDSTGKKRFYVLLRDGKTYGRISIELYAYYNNQIPGLIRLSYTINPSGSRILR